jgi:hypothetical protein
MDLQEISDRLEIQELFARYSHAIDTMDWDLLDEVFTADAHIDYTSMGGIAGDLATQKAYLASTLPALFKPGYQHLVSNTLFEIDGDTARTRTMCFNPMVFQEQGQVLFCGLWYRDVLLRVDGRWRIVERVEDRGWMLDVKP